MQYFAVQNVVHDYLQAGLAHGWDAARNVIVHAERVCHHASDKTCYS